MSRVRVPLLAPTPGRAVVSADDVAGLVLAGGKARRLTGHDSNNVRPSWSHDGQWIYFGSDRTGDWELWKEPAQGGQPVQLTRKGGREGFESEDGKFVYYVRGFGLAGLWKVPTELCPPSGGPALGPSRHRRQRRLAAEVGRLLTDTGCSCRSRDPGCDTVHRD